METKTNNSRVAWIVIILVIVGVLVWSSYSKKLPALSIGDITALSGPAAYYGDSNMKGAEVGKMKASEEHKGLTINMYHEDSLFTPKGGIDAYNKLRSVQKVNTILVMASNVSVAVEPLALKDNVLIVAASTLANNYTTPNDLSFRLTAKGDLEAVPAIQYLATKKLTKLGIIYINNDIGVSLKDSLKKNSDGTSVKIVAEEGFTPDVKDFKTLLLKMKSAGVDSIYLATLASQSNVILTQANDLGIKVPFVSYRGAEDPALLKAGKLAENVVYTNAYDSNSTSGENTEFVKMYQAKYGEVPNGFAAEAYEAVRLIADTYEKCGETSVSQKAKDCAISFLTSIKDRLTVLGPITFDTNGDVSYQFFMKTVKDGKFVKVQ